MQRCKTPLLAGLFLAIALLLCLPTANAQVVPDRATLNVLLGFGGTTENFESYIVGSTGADPTFTTSLDSTTIVNGQGPGLIVPGIMFSDVSNGGMQWNDFGYYGQPSKDILSGNLGLRIDFLQPTDIFGLDMLAFSGYTDAADISVFDTGGNLVYSTTGVLVPDAPSSTFFGYQNAGGIGYVTLTGTIWRWSPIIDDVTFGNIGVTSVVPEASSLTLFSGFLIPGAFLLRRRFRKTGA